MDDKKYTFEKVSSEESTRNGQEGTSFAKDICGAVKEHEYTFSSKFHEEL